MVATTTDTPVGTGAPVRCSTTHRALVEALNAVSMAVPARTPVPELRGVLVEAGADGVVLRAYDRETAVTVRTDAEPGGEGRSLLTHAELKMVLEGAAAGESRAAVAAMRVDLADDVLTTPDLAVPLTPLPAGAYPAFPPAARGGVVVDGQEWFRQLARVLPAASPTDSPPGLAAVRFEVKSGGVHMAASDRYRLAVAAVPAQRGGTTRKRPATALVPARVLTQIARRLEKHDGPVSVGVHTPRGRTRPLVTFVIGAVEITVHGADGTLPHPDTLMPAGDSLAVEVDRTAMVRAAKKASALAKAKALGVHVVAIAVEQSGERITLAPRLETAAARARVKGIEVAARTVTGHDRLEGAPLTVNGGFLLDALDAFAGDTVTLHLRGLREPILLTDGHSPAGTGYRHLMMPVAAR